ncbi:nonsense-mediated mRNA decay factor SMG8-like [Ylistrum balloti]|uniref:nonsense-mediated mRNA decay factor SMG8-like n=1 Tax=Ylistrum balloti TaxID=509963 RepID=UPI0029058B6F|nr:nonsense-mediated mRNA decay factor SMG8-like [Ylistrum balloti]
MAAPLGVLSFPLVLDPHTFPNKDKKVVVISIIGKSELSGFASKASILNPLLEKDVFKCVPGAAQEITEKGDIECYYDNEGQAVYLHHRSLYDVHRLAMLSQKLVKEESAQDLFSLWQKDEYKTTKTLLWMFSVSHIVLLSHPGSSFDISYVRMFRTLDTIRLKLQHCVTEQLQNLPISKDWYHSGRPCSPRVLFVFNKPGRPEHLSDDVDTGTISKKSSQVRKPQHSMEDQIYRILRKSRVITNISNNSLFAVPANQEFVFLHGHQPEVTDPVQQYLHQLRNNSTLNKDSDSPRSYQANRRSAQSGLHDMTRSSSRTQRSGSSSNFKEFLSQHIETALGRGFDDNVGRNPVPPIFDVPTCQTWFNVSSKLYNFFFGDTVSGKAQATFNTLKSLLETDIRFSENRCNKVLPLAEAAYQEGLPTHYITNFHLTKLAQAHRVFYQFARGPACEKYLKQLEAACEKYWKNGHQLCEEVSLTGNHCVNPLHRLPEEGETEDNAHLPVMAHSSQMKTKAVCNCGRKQADKDDPFDHKTANFDFFDALEKVCCEELKHIEMPVFQPSTTEVRACQLLATPDSKTENKDIGGKQDVISGLTNLSLALSLGQSGASDYFGHTEGTGGGSLTTDDHPSKTLDHQGETSTSDQMEETTKEGGVCGNQEETTHPDVTGTVADVKEEAEHPREGLQQSNERTLREITAPPQDDLADLGSEHIDHISDPPADMPTCTVDEVKDDPISMSESELIALRQHSTTEYLPGMLHSESPLGLLPKFPSWALTCLGKSTLYSHTLGLELPGFLHGSNYLLPWDITAKIEKEKWPSVGEMASRKGKQKKISPKDVGELSVRVFLGDEYECPRGHRFFCSGPEKIIKVSNTSTVKDNATKLVNLDMPLYCSCPHCRSSKGFLAQLMRLYIVTPDSPLRITLCPQIQPAPPPCPLFGLGFEGPVELPPGGLWCLRIPHVYMGDAGPYTIPSDQQSLQHCHMLKGVYNYKVSSPDS